MLCLYLSLLATTKFIASKLFNYALGPVFSYSYKMRRLPPCFLISEHFDLLILAFSLITRTSIVFTSVNMSDDDREASGDKWVEACAWSHVDLLEFLRPAFWALLAFMLLPRWWDNHELTVAALNGQALYMVSFLFLLFYFVF